MSRSIVVATWIAAVGIWVLATLQLPSVQNWLEDRESAPGDAEPQPVRVVNDVSISTGQLTPNSGLQVQADCRGTLAPSQFSASDDLILNIECSGG